jgi:hypothetical protein
MAHTSGVEMMESKAPSSLPEHFVPETKTTASSQKAKFSLPPPVRGRDQLHALLRRQWLHKVCSNNPAEHRNGIREGKVFESLRKFFFINPGLSQFFFGPKCVELVKSE